MYGAHLFIFQIQISLCHYVIYCTISCVLLKNKASTQKLNIIGLPFLLFCVGLLGRLLGSLLRFNFINVFNRFNIFPWIKWIRDSYWFCFLSNQNVTLTKASQSFTISLPFPTKKKKKMMLLCHKICKGTLAHWCKRALW